MPAFSEIFYTSLISTLSGIFLAILAACYKSKCSDVSLCFGLIQLKRNINVELIEDMRTTDIATSRENTTPQRLQGVQRASIDRLPSDVP